MTELNNLSQEENKKLLDKIDSKAGLLVTGAKIHGNGKGLHPSKLNSLLEAIVWNGKLPELYNLAKKNGLLLDN